ncbi:MAG: hypothetical protein E7345_01090 [Clostridiales bacterium]|nr:hypothetical protein [Clostridiales bacterium]
MELIQVANFVNGKFLLSNYKKDKKEILNSELLASYSLDSLGTSSNEKIYFDTADSFFATHGINIYTVLVNKTTKELVVRYDDSQVERIDFLRNIPNFFKVKIGKDDSIHKCYEQITEAIHRVFPSGLSENIEDKLRNSKPQVIIHKKRETYRVVNNDGLKMSMSFDKSEYVNTKTRKKAKQESLDVVGDAFKTKEDFEYFLKLMIRDFPKLIRITDNELTLSKDMF